MATRSKTNTGKRSAHDKAAEDLNEDPLTGEPGAHPVGVGIGAAVGGTQRALPRERSADRSGPQSEPLSGEWPVDMQARPPKRPSIPRSKMRTGVRTIRLAPTIAQRLPTRPMLRLIAMAGNRECATTSSTMKRTSIPPHPSCKKTGKSPFELAGWNGKRRDMRLATRGNARPNAAAVKASRTQRHVCREGSPT